jgi:hypothetical protein
VSGAAPRKLAPTRKPTTRKPTTPAPTRKPITPAPTSPTTTLAPTSPTTYAAITNDNIKAAVKSYYSESEVERASAASTYGPISNWDTSTVTDMSDLFNSLIPYPGPPFGPPPDLYKWDTSRVTTLARLLKEAFFR